MRSAGADALNERDQLRALLERTSYELENLKMAVREYLTRYWKEEEGGDRPSWPTELEPLVGWVAPDDEDGGLAGGIDREVP